MTDTSAASSMTSSHHPEPVGAVRRILGGDTASNGRTLLLRLILLTAAYFLASVFGKLLTLAPGHASPLWPAAGVALAALLVWGPRLWPGVWLGAFLFNFLLDPSTAVIPMAAAVASGATLAALVGAKLTRRLLTPANSLHESDLWRFLLLAGPVPCLIAATIGVTSFSLAGRLTADEIVSQWLLWWVGDSIGVVLFAPVFLSFCPGTGAIWPRCRGRIGLHLITTALLLTAAHRGLDRLEEVQTTAAVEQQMGDVYEHGFLHLPDLIRDMTSIERFFAASQEVNSQEFATFTATILLHPALTALDWAPRVTGNERQDFEAKTSSQLLEIDANGQAAKAGERPEYFPILFSASQRPLRSMSYHDHGAWEERRAAMDLAGASGATIATPMTTLHRTGNDAILLFTPVYRHDFAAGTATTEERRLALRGFIVGLSETKFLFATLAQTAKSKGVLFRVTDLSPDGPAQVLAGTLPEEAAAAWHQDIPFAGRTWRLELQPAAAVWQDGGSLMSRLDLGFSLLAALLVAFAALSAANRIATTTASEHFTAAILDSLSAHVAVLAADGQIIATNRAWRDFAQANGCAWQAVSEGTNYLTVCGQAAQHGDSDAAMAAQKIRDAMSGQQGTWFHEYPCHSPDEQRWFYCVISRFTINETRYVVTAHENITPMRQAQAALETSQERYRRLVENLGSEYFFYQHDSSGQMQYASASVEAILGYPAETFRGHYSAYLMESPANQTVAAKIEFVLRHGVQSTFPLLARCQDDTDRWLEITALPVRDTAGQITGVEGIAHDIHQRTLDELELQQLTYHLEEKINDRTQALITTNNKLLEQESQIHAILDNLLDCVITINDQGIVQSANQAVHAVLGYTPEELIGHNISRIAPEPHRGRHDEYLARYLREGVPHIIGIGREVEGKCRDGLLVPIELSVNEFSRHGQKFFTGILRDISERKQFIAELTEAREAAEKANRAKSTFLATMSHEIRTPMNGVIGMAEVLEQSALTTSQADMVHTIRESATSLLRLIDDILDFSKTEAGRLEIEQIPVALVELIEDLCQSLVPMALAKEIRFDLFIAPDMPELVTGDPLRLRQIFYNLLGNAIKFADPGQTKRPGRISLRAEVTQARPPQLIFTISDNGIGMTAEAKAQLFTPFTQADKSTTRRFGGTGLGLTICHRLVAMMGGDITAQSQPDQGSVFTVTLPLPAQEEQPRRLCPDLTGVDCLLTDSPHFDQAGLTAYLEYAGARVITAAAQADPKSPLVVILDGSDDTAAAETLFAPFADLPVLRIAGLLLTRGRRRLARQENDKIFTLDGIALRRRSFIEAVALAVGRDIPDPLPRRHHQEPTLDRSTPLPSLAEARAQGRLILVAEDDGINQKVILQQLALLGHRAEVADNGAEALRMWRTGDYKLLLTDLHMPVMDGYTLTAAIRREEASGQRMPILALTANASHGEAQHAATAGMDEYLTKPIHLQALSAALKKWLPQSEGSPQPAPATEMPDSEKPLAAAMDITVLQGLVGDDAGTVREFIADYLASALQLGAELIAAATAGNGAQVKNIAHKLKSSSRTVGAATLADLCLSLEQAGQTGDQKAIRQGMAEFETVLRAVEAECRLWLQQHKTTLT